VTQPASGEIGIDQRHGDAHLRQAQPAGEVLGAILHEERRDVAAAQPRIERPVGHTIGRGVELAVGLTAVSVEQNRVIRPRPRLTLEQIRDRSAASRPVGCELR
jgi:hypothetical protein